MKLSICLAISLAAATVPAAAQQRVTTANHKATAPVELDLTSAGADSRHLRVTARPRVPAASMTVSVSVEDGLVLSGPAEWRATARPGEESTRQVDARVTGSGEQRVVVSATLTFADGSAQTALQVFVLNPAPPTHGLARLPSPDVVTGPGGRRVVEVMTGRP